MKIENRGPAVEVKEFPNVPASDPKANAVLAFPENGVLDVKDEERAAELVREYPRRFFAVEEKASPPKKDKEK